MSISCRFVSCIQLFLQYDSVCPQGVTQQVTHRVAPLLTGTTYGDIVRHLNSVIQVRHDKLIVKMYRIIKPSQKITFYNSLKKKRWNFIKQMCRLRRMQSLHIVYNISYHAITA